MSGSQNFQVWNPNGNNQETDAQYVADTQRSGGAVAGIFPSSTFNKFAFQVSTMIAAIATELANRGYNISDGNQNGIVSALDNCFGVPVGTIVDWAGSILSIPANWHLCDGSNGTPDLRDKFVVGAGLDYAVGVTGGEAAHILTNSEAPALAHTHGINDNGHNHPFTVIAQNSDSNGSGAITGGINNSSNDGTYSGTTGTDATGISVQNSGAIGGGVAHNNLPPYYALAKIMRIS